MTATIQPTALDSGSTPVEPEGRARSLFPNISAVELLILGFVFLLPIACSPKVFASFITPKAALALVVVGPALVSLVLAAIARDRPAILGGLFLGACVASTLWADVPTMAFFGSYRSPDGLVFIALLVGVWSLGRRLGPEARRLLVPVIVAAATICAAVGCLQVYVDLGAGWLEPFQDRAVGLMSNPVHLAGLCTGAGFLAAFASLSGRRRWIWLVALVPLAAATQLSGSRIGIVALVVGVLYLVFRHRRAALPALLVVVAAVAFTIMVPAQSYAASSTRLAEGASDGGLSSRLNVWSSALDAVVERPLLGYGPARFTSATGPRTDLAAARYTGGDLLYGDAHNVFIEYLTTTGLIGFGLGLAWIIAASRRARGPLVGFCLVVLASMLFEPQFVGLTPIVLLALGAAGPPLARLPETPGWSAVGRGAATASLLLALIGIALGAALLVGDAKYASAVFDGSVSSLNDGEKTLPPWPQFPALRGVLYASAAQHFRNAMVGHAAIAAELGAIDRDPYDPQWWWLRGQLEESYGTPAKAQHAYRHALELNPWSAEAMLGLTRLANKAGNHAEVEHWRTRLCKLGPTQCLKKSQIPILKPDPPRAG
ncbi:MAG: O-antigen ligase family protein [Acidimicrobiia bacterium]